MRHSTNSNPSRLPNSSYKHVERHYQYMNNLRRTGQKQTDQTSQTRIKICGITTQDDRDIAVAAGADAVGFISGVTVETPREVTPETAATLVATTPPFVSTVLVTMPERVHDVVERIEHVRPDIVQVHGLSPDAVECLSSMTTTAVIPAVTAADTACYEQVADALLVDSLDENGAGGTGSTHDWERTRDKIEKIDTPVVLAGGLTPENVSRAIEIVDPYGVDVASGVEQHGGEKDADAVRSFVEQARRAV